VPNICTCRPRPMVIFFSFHLEFYNSFPNIVIVVIPNGKIGKTRNRIWFLIRFSMPILFTKIDFDRFRGFKFFDFFSLILFSNNGLALEYYTSRRKLDNILGTRSTTYHRPVTCVITDVVEHINNFTTLRNTN